MLQTQFFSQYLRWWIVIIATLSSHEIRDGPRISSWGEPEISNTYIYIYIYILNMHPYSIKKLPTKKNTQK